MKSDVITITNQGSGFEQALLETQKAAEYKGFSAKEALHLQLLTEEMLSMVEIVAGEVKASFWLECEGKKADLHLTTNTVLDKQKRAQLISASTSRKNEAANSFLGRIRDAFEEAMADEGGSYQMPYDLSVDIIGRDIADTEYDRYECSVLRRLADDVKVSIRGNVVDMTVSKTFAD